LTSSTRGWQAHRRRQYPEYPGLTAVAHKEERLVYTETPVAVVRPGPELINEINDALKFAGSQERPLFHQTRS
jgi:hypothetical protein